MDRLTATRVFVEVVERGSQTAAAEALEMSRAMVSRYLGELETWVGARLLHRTTRKLSLTGAGELLLEQCREMLVMADAMQSVSRTDEAAPRGTLRIACSQSLAQAWLVHALDDFTRLYPQVSVDLLVGSQAVNLVEARIDLALRITNQLDPNLIARQLAVCRSVVCATPAYLARHGTPQRPEDLAQHNCLSYAYFGRSIWEFSRAGEPHAVAVSGNLSANESMVLLEAVLADIGISLQPRYSVGAHLRSGALVQLLPDYEPQQLGIHALYGTRRQMPPALRALLDFLIQRLADRPDWDL
ncbi:transcriptional regulator, LysR family [Pseudomonas peli]|jgi:DNA-binding transcriptional LysR family regulator|uniref:Transcriptional regulator, LysR family n=1 Tax=Pseudomonas peli TaxID=592361 RepID=A0AB37ZC68_9PSED|nr:LysR family transcriptional regulator [Pseudomonas peli]MDR7026138.1 DNA-binding transcriptional LysR family regulator [Pseudomonas peli]NMZ70789.1 LysR family transcriptional regulator [Pseudomonas peli]SCW83578.1 transcriptional regulator, LysR family [Pseudomonas peli]|tara:strand:+ start:9944 stop:10843 length:900 start_codon:yes stop_codon:yes gene_type:complete